MRRTSASIGPGDLDTPPPLDLPTPSGALDAPAARRNAAPLLAVLRAVLPATGTVLEVGSGTGQHAAAFAAALTPRLWLPTEVDDDRRSSVALWAALTPPDTRPLPARALDAAASSQTWPISRADNIRAMVSSNVIHIAPWEVAHGLIAGAAHWLEPGDPLILYGPFHRDGRVTSDGNAAFDAELRRRDPRCGIRDLEREVVPAAEAAGMRLDTLHPMPANNLAAVFRRT